MKRKPELDKPQTADIYLEWLFTTTDQRQPKTLTDLAAQLHVPTLHIAQLALDPHFQARVRARMMQALLEFMPEQVARYLEETRKSTPAQAGNFLRQLHLLSDDPDPQEPKVIIGIDPEQL